MFNFTGSHDKVYETIITCVYISFTQKQMTQSLCLIWHGTTMRRFAFNTYYLPICMHHSCIKPKSIYKGRIERKGRQKMKVGMHEMEFGQWLIFRRKKL